jgi:lipopolysaccharide cholinephosphotransferase
MNGNGDYKVLNAYDHPEIFHAYYARLVYPDTNMKTWDYPYIESLGINIDIFPLWGFPENQEEANLFADKMEELHVAFIEEYIKNPLPSKRYYELQKEILAMMDKYPFDESTNIGYLLSRHKKKEIMPRKIYANAVMSEFEGELFAIPEGYDDYLTRLFGKNYMELPPETERYSVHNYRAFIKDKSILG